VKYGWVPTTLGDICTIQSGAGFPKKFQGRVNGAIPFFKVSDMNLEGNETVLQTANNYITEDDRSELGAQIFPAGSIVFPKVGGAIATNKKRQVKRPSCVDNNVMGLIPSDSAVDGDYLWHWLLGQDIFEFSNKANPPSITQSSVKAWPFFLPPLDEQKRIVAVLDQAFAALDRARTLAEANLADAESLFDGVLKKAFQTQSAWPLRSLSEISTNLDRQRVPITKHERQPGDIPYYGASGVVDHVAGHLFDEDLLLVSEDGANLLARTYPIAFSVSGKSWVNNHAHVLRFEDFVAQEYVRLYLNSITLEPYVSGMAQPKLNQKALNQIPIPFAGERERAAIVAEVQIVRERCDALAGNYQTQLADLANLRQSLLQKAFAGELT